MVTRIQRTQGTGTSTKKFTFSGWIKKASNTTSNDQVVFESNNDANNRITTYFRGSTNNTFNIYGALSGSTIINIETTRLFRDISAWYHIVVAVDTTQGTATDRIKIYVNGTQETAFNYTSTYPSQDANLPIGSSSYVNTVGYYAHGGSSAFDGCMSHLHFIDGYVYDASSFGETDATTGEWKIKTSPSVTYGNNGFFILKDGNSVTDQSGNGNNLTVATGTLTKTEDNPSNVFATGNPLDNGADKSPFFLNGNNSYSVPSGVWRYAISSLGMSKGKFYMEQKIGSGGNHFAGATDQYDNLLNTQTYAGSTSLSVGYYNNGNRYIGDNATSYGNSYTSGDIIGVAIDIDNGKIYFSKNGTWQNSGVPTSGSTGTGAIDLPTSANSHGTWFFVPSVNNSTLDVNYGNGYFGTTAVASAGTNASGIGIFEYDVPTGYTALSTKGLNL